MTPAEREAEAANSVLPWASRGRVCEHEWLT